LAAIVAIAGFVSLDGGGRGGRERAPPHDARRSYERNAAKAGARASGGGNRESDAGPLASQVLVASGSDAIVGAVVSIFDEGEYGRGSWELPSLVAAARTDAEGICRFEDLPPHLFAGSPPRGFVLVEAKGFAPSHSRLRPSLAFTLEAAARWRFQVVDTEGDPVPTAQAAFLWAGVTGTTRIYDADPSGWIDMPVVPGTRVRAPGYRTVAREFQEGPVVLEPGSVCAGRVVDEEGEPVRGAVISIDEGVHETAVAGNDGSFRFEGVASGRLMLGVAAPEHPAIWHVSFSGEEDVRIVLPRFASVSGRILLPDGSPAAGAGCWIVESGPFGEVHEADRGGEFVLPSLEPGRVTFGFSSRDGAFKARLALVLASGERRTDVSVHLAPAYSYLRLRVEGATGEVSLSHDSHTWSVPWADPVVLSVAPGTETRLRVSDAVTTASIRCVTSATPEIAPILVDLAPRRKVHVILVDAEGAPIPDSGDPDVRVGCDFGTGEIRVTREAGRFEFELPPSADGSFELRAIASGFAEEVREPWNPPQEGEVRIALRRAGFARFRLRRPEGASPVPVWLEGWSGRIVEIGDEGDGRFVTAPAPEGELEIWASPPGVVAVRLATCRILPGETIDLGTIDLPAQRPGRLLVISERGEPLGGARGIVFAPCTGAPGGWFDWELATAGADGILRIPVPPDPASRAVVARTGRGARVLRPSELDGPLALPPESRLRVRAPDDGAELGVQFGGMPVPWFCGVAEPVEDTSSRQELFSGLPPGRVTVVARKSGKETQRDCDLAPGATAEVDLR